MYTRTLYATGDPATIDDAVEALRTQGQKLLGDQPGYRGIGCFVDRQLGKLTVGTWWDDEKSRQDSDDALREEREAMLAPYVSTLATDNWEVAVNQRPTGPVQPGAGFRLGRLEFAPTDADKLVAMFKDFALPRFQAIPGFQGSALFLDRAKGRATVGVVYADHDALVASRASQAAVRGEAISKTPFVLRSLEEFEVAFMTRVDPS